MFLNEKPSQEECEAMQRINDKINDAGLTFDLLACVQLARVFVHYGVKGFQVEEKELIQADN